MRQRDTAIESPIETVRAEVNSRMGIPSERKLLERIARLENLVSQQSVRISELERQIRSRSTSG